MNRDLLRRFFHRTREWSRAHRGAALIQLVSEALEECAEVDSGFFLYRRRIRNGNKLDVYMPWGVFQGDESEISELLALITEQSQALSNVMERWILAEDIPSPEICEAWSGLNLLEFGIWPILSREETIGYIVVARTSAVSTRMTTEMGHAIMDSCAAQVGFALDVIMALRIAEQASQTDLLTGVFNRRGIELRWDEVVARSRRLAKPLVLCIADVDDFKRINDQHGHPAGDEMLRVVASTLRSLRRPDEIVGRLGGDEFLYAYFSDETNVLTRVDDVNEAVNRVLNGYTLSIGAAVLGIDGDDFSSLYRCADEHLYKSKRERQATCEMDVEFS